MNSHKYTHRIQGIILFFVMIVLGATLTTLLPTGTQVAQCEPEATSLLRRTDF